MFAAIDEAQRRAVYRVRGAKITDAQWSHYADTFARLGGKANPGPRCCLICASEPGSGMPDARWRQRFAEIAGDIRADTVFVLVAPSAIARGVLTAVNWIRPFPFHQGVTDDWPSAVSVACGFDPSPTLRVSLETLFREAKPVPP